MKGRTPWSTGLTAETDDRVARIANSKLKYPVDKETLYTLYTVENLSLATIGEQFGVSKQVIKRLVGEYELERQSAPRDDLTQEIVIELYEQGYSLDTIAQMYQCNRSVVKRIGGNKLNTRDYRNQAGVDADRETLNRLYWDEWLSFEEIADRLGVDFTTIPYWLKKFDIPIRTNWETRRGPDWQAPSPEVIIHLYQAENLGMQNIGELFGTTRTYIRRVLEEQGVPIRRPGYPNISMYTAKDGHKVKSGLELQVDDWLYHHQIKHTYEPQIPNTRYFADFLVGETYVEIWGIVGNETYDKKRSKKLKAYERQGLQLLSVYQHDFPDLHVLKSLLKDFV